MSDFHETLAGALSGMGLPLGDGLVDSCYEYYSRVVEVNQHLNLTRITDEAQAARQHFADAMALARYIDVPRGCRVIDIGTGAGFPGVPIKLLRSDIELTLLDASGKKTDFIRETLGSMNISASVLCARAEEAAKTELRESFDLALSRAVAPLPMLLELCIPFLRTGGTLATWKGESFAQELESAHGALQTLGCAEKAIHSIGLGALLLIEKQKPTPEKFPRRFAKIKSDPL